jgi:DNA-binding NarL/FixJ family response regulator
VRKSVYDCRKERHHPAITRPKVLLVVGHPSIGAALETLLRIEDRYEVRRAQSLEQAAPALTDWMPDLAVVDGVLMKSGRTEVFAMPAIVLSGNPQDGRRLSAQFADGRGWLRKDATAEELRAAVDAALAKRAGSRNLARVVAIVVVVALVALAIAWYLLRMRT